jgi:hypothetical protein
LFATIATDQTLTLYLTLELLRRERRDEAGVEEGGKKGENKNVSKYLRDE